jgi:tRNA A37 threonylcarbamoyltransferase TsaD
VQAALQNVLHEGAQTAAGVTSVTHQPVSTMDHMPAHFELPAFHHSEYLH